MFFVIGLGNPDNRYVGTRHNLGFEVIDFLAEKLRISFKAGRGEYLIAHRESGPIPLSLVKPLTYMNESGLAVLDIVERFEAPLEHLLVVCDDFQLPLGQIRIRTQGSDGGHNGLYSIIYHLQSEQFARLRCGIASQTMPTEKQRMADFVLDPFDHTELPIVHGMIERAADACLFSCANGVSAAMNEFNQKLGTDSNSPSQ
jgi:PTH1 family peptidyl-tRNA hydrolase